MLLLVKRLKSQGLLHLAETTFNRFVPAWLFRFSVGDVFDLDVAKLSQLGDADDAKTKQFQLTQHQGLESTQQLREVTWNSVPLSCSAEHFGYSISGKIADEQQLLGGVWGGFGNFVEQNLGFDFRLKPNEGWIYCAYIDKAARGMGVYKRVLSFACAKMKENGFDRQLVVVQPWNKASTYIHKKYSKETAGRIIALRFLFLSMIFCTGKLKKDRTFTCRITKSPIQLST